MTISSTTRKAGPFDGNDVTTSFPFAFKVFSAGDITVVRTMPSGIEETLVLDSDYSVTLNGDQDANPGGTITYPISGDPLPDGWRLTAVGDLDSLQPTDITNGGGFYPQVIENALDRVTMLVQQLEEELGRTIRIAVSDDVTDGLELPAQGGRAARVLGFDADGNFTTYERVTATAQTTYRKFTATAGQTVFSLPNIYTPGANSLYVWMNGAKLINGDDYVETSTTSFTLTSGAVEGVVVEAIAGVPTSSITVSDAGVINFTQSGTGAVGRTAQAKMRDIVSVKDFGAVGDGVTDDTAAVQNALNAATGKVLLLGTGETYKYTALTIKTNTTVICNGSTFSRASASATHGIVIESGVTVDALVIATPGGAGGDRAAKIIGSNVNIGKFSITAAAEGVYNSANYALEVESTPAGTQLSDIFIGDFSCSKFTAGVFARNVTKMFVEKSLVQYYRTAYYLRDVSRSEFSNVTCALTSAASYGSPGENGLLIESTIADNSCFDLRFTNWTVSNAGEHSFRLGGQKIIRDVWFENCRSYKSGSSIVVNNPAATEWHGGCGFKILGPTTVSGKKHRNIFFTNCHVEDINESYGSFPAGHGAGNYSGFQVAVASNVHITGCSVKKRDNTNYSCGYGVELLASDHVYMNDLAIDDIYQTVRIYEAGSVGTYPGWDLPCTEIYFDGCRLASGNPGISYVLHIGEGAQNFNHDSIHVRSCNIHGGAAAVRIEPVTGTGAYSNIYLDFTYTGCTANPASSTTPIVIGASVAVGNIRAPWHAAASSPSLANGSIWQDTYGGSTRTKQDGAWAKTSSKRSLVVADDAVGTVVPPASTGHILVTGGGVVTHILAWFRASSSPASLKYGGAATATIVDTALTGTTGSDGAITIGVQNNLLYIENRSGASETFTITFL